jgi:hypothetical protein
LIKRIHFPKWTVPLTLLGVCIAGFGLLIPWLGFYQDDWYQIWFGQAFGTRVFVDFYSFERPFIAWLYMLTTPLLGANPTVWQIFGLVWRWIAALAVLWVCLTTRKKWTFPAVWVALLFAVYPAFRQQFASVIYSHYFLQFVIQMASIGLMALAIRGKRFYWLLTLLALALGAIGLFTSEYFFGLEITRPFFLWLLLFEEKRPPIKNQVKGLLKFWWPYLSLVLIYLVWRVFIFQFPTYQPFFSQNPQAGIFHLIFQFARNVGLDVIDSALTAWVLPLQTLSGLSFSQITTWAAVLVAVFAAAGLYFYMRHLEISDDDMPEKPSQKNTFAVWLLITGLVSMIASGFPFWFAGLRINTDLDGGSRFAISLMLGASLFAVGLIELLRNQKMKILVVSILVGLGITQHISDAVYFRDMHRLQATFFQQLLWRAPELSPGTLVLTSQLPGSFQGDNSLTAALNWIYDQSPNSLTYMLLYLPERLDSGIVPALEPGIEVVKGFRTALYQGSTSEALAVYFPYPHCLRVLDPQIESDLPRPLDMPRSLKDAARISNLGQIIASSNRSDRLPEPLFKYFPPENSWCYFYQKAELARQQQAWAEVVLLADQALGQKANLDDTYEILPYLEGYARAGEYLKVENLVRTMISNRPEGRATTQAILCTTLERIGQSSDKDEALEGFVSRLSAEIGCP